jgi:succinate dehydrogenase/fumarate reductase flavoprotein subunit
VIGKLSKMKKESFDLIVLGGGLSGLAAVYFALEKGLWLH